MDAILMGAVARELSQVLAGSRVNSVHQPDDRTLYMGVHPPRDTFLVLGCPRSGNVATISTTRPAAPPSPPIFCQLARARFADKHITSVEVLGHDRVLIVGFTGGHQLVAEFFGATPDLYVIETATGRILGHLRPGPPTGRLAAGVWTPPSPGRGVSPLDLPLPLGEQTLMASVLAPKGSDESLRLVGLPPGFMQALRDLGETRGWSAATERMSTWLEAVRAGRYQPLAFAGPKGSEVWVRPLDPGDAPDAEPRSLLDVVRETFLESARAGRLDARRREMMLMLASMRKRQEERRVHAAANLARCDEAQDWENKGNLLKYNLAQVKPFLKTITLTDHTTGEPVTIPIKADLNPRQNMERLFARARKLKRSRPIAIEQLTRLDGTLERLSILDAELRAAGDLESMEAVVARIRALGRVEGPAKKAGKVEKGAPSGPLEFISSDGFRIVVGRNARENELVSHRMARGHDMWLHARDQAGSHVIVRMAGRDQQCPRTTLEEAAQLAAYYSKARTQGKVEVLVTRAGKVRRARGGATGSVNVEGGDTVRVRPDPHLPGKLTQPL